MIVIIDVRNISVLDYEPIEHLIHLYMQCEEKVIFNACMSLTVYISHISASIIFISYTMICYTSFSSCCMHACTCTQNP